MILSIIIAFILWTIMFCPYIDMGLNFWAMMTISALILSSFAITKGGINHKDWGLKLSNAFLGIAFAAFLWIVFFVGHHIASLIFSFERSQIGSIYALKQGSNAYLIAAALLLIIGPAEEIFWRGFVQKRLGQRLGANKGFVIATLIYTIVHITSLNFMLIMAAFVAGLAWGLAYRLFPNRLFMLIISHALWDAAIFIFFPIS